MSDDTFERLLICATLLIFALVNGPLLHASGWGLVSNALACAVGILGMGFLRDATGGKDRHY